ncbi:hypothetical protein KOW79_018449 [Hemibagrus wyckioides]|uniref:Uncharacterized protein n=1 Tax=Hemibagrus wyckioides TaxID=337641 RepID=A0A9D3SH19_9TELE|nr:hypothetical protein KOW79_018449 [Hemibagrus wyckioides]
MYISPADSSRFGSSGNLSQASSQFSSEPEERCVQENQIRSPISTSPRLSSQEFEKGEREARTSGQEKRKENILAIQAESSFRIDSPPLASSRLRWLKAINKVRVHLHQFSCVPQIRLELLRPPFNFRLPEQSCKPCTNSEGSK